MKVSFLFAFVLAACLLALSLSSCKRYRERQEVMRLVNEWQGREILFPDNPCFTSMATDTVSSPDAAAASYKIFTYVDGASCVECQLHLQRWLDLMAEIDSISTTVVPFLFYVGTKDLIGFRQLLMKNSFDYPICIDVEDRINDLNLFPQRGVFRTFLLDGDNRVLVIGNPVTNVRIKQLFLEEIKKAPAMGNPYQAVIRADRKEIDMGMIRLGQAKTVKVKLTNEGNRPFVLDGITTSCDCTEAKCSWTEIPVGKSRSLTVRFKAEDEGDFIREIYLSGNLPESPYVITLNGCVGAYLK